MAVFTLTVSPSAYPGESARSIARVLGLFPQAPVEHPVWRMIARAVAEIPLLTLPLRLNLFSALCGALTVALLFRLTCRALFEIIRADSLAETRFYVADEAESEEQPAVSNRAQLKAVALQGGITASLALAFGAPFWAASVGAHPETFDMLLFTLMSLCLMSYIKRGTDIGLLLTSFLFGLGLTENVLFVLSMPVVLYLILRAANRHDQLSEHLFYLMVAAGLVGFGAGILALVGVTASQAPFNFQQLLVQIKDLARLQANDLTLGLPSGGWSLVLAEALVPLFFVFVSAKGYFITRDHLIRRLCVLLNLGVTAAAVFCLLDHSHSPWGLARQTFRTPVIPGLATALTLGVLFAYWRLVTKTPLLTYETDDYYTPPSRPMQALALSMTALIGASVALAPFHNLGDVDGRKGAFADSLARELLALTGDASCLVSDGVLNTNIRIQAYLQARKLTLVCSDGSDTPVVAQTNQMASLVSGAPRKGDPHGESPKLFVEHWLQKNPWACSQVVVATSPCLWEHAGFHAVPNVLVYLGTNDVSTVDARLLLKRHEAVWERMDAIVAQGVPRPPMLESIVSDVGQQASRVANDLGVLLETQGHAKEADTAYGRAVRLNERNLLAVFNLYGLRLRNPALGDTLEQESQIKTAARQIGKRFLFESNLESYGTLIIQPQSLLEQLSSTVSIPLVVQWMAYCESHDAQGFPLGTANSNTPAATEAREDQALQTSPAENSGASESQLRTHLRTHPNDLSGWATLAEILMAGKNSNDVATFVLPAMRRAAGENGSDLLDLVEGNLALSQSRYRDAQTFFKRALSLCPDSKKNQQLLLLSDRLLNNINASENDATKILEADPNNHAANALLGNIRMSQKRYEEAEKYLRKSLALNPTPEAFNDLAELLRVRGGSSSVP